MAKDVVGYLDTNPQEVPEESRHILEIDPSNILEAVIGRQSYWLLVMKVARRAGRKVAGQGLRQGTGIRARESRRRWSAAMRSQYSLDTREVEQAAEGWGVELALRTIRRRLRAGGSAALRSNKMYQHLD